MKASYRWIRELLPTLAASPREVAHVLTSLGLEVEGQATFGVESPRVVVARVLAARPHPSKSGLLIVHVDHGDGTRDVVCGAPNVPAPGGLVALALEGASLPAKGIVVEARAVAGVISAGMLCSESELGLGDDAAGLWVLEGDHAPGAPLTSAFPSAHDTIFELGITPNRPDALGHLGIARDLAAKLGLTLVEPTSATVPGEGDTDVRVDIEEPDRCAAYGAARVRGVRVGPAPAWVRHRLVSLGVRPVSNVVDATNLVLLERGHPLHAFDLRGVEGGHVIVRSARGGEGLVTLDGKARELTEDDLVIADPTQALALAGIMGGEASEIRGDTTDILLECAYFDPRGVRRSARRHALHSEASHRFERGVDPAAIEPTLARATQMLVEFAGGTPARACVVVRARTIPKRSIWLRSARLDALVGAPVPFDEALVVLQRLGCEVIRDGTAATILAPTHRPDLSREADLVEEVARVRGMDAIPPRLPRVAAKEAEPFDARAAVRAAAISLGLSEAVTYAFVSPSALDALGAPSPVVRLDNPLTEERSVMRTSILPGLLEAASRAARRGVPASRLFTVGRIFLPPRDGEALPREQRRLGAVLCGPRAAWLTKAEPHDALDAKSIAEELVGRATGHEVAVIQHLDGDVPAHHHPRASASFVLGDIQLGTFGLLHPDVAERFELPAAAVLELDLDALARLGRRTPRAHPVPGVPAVLRDLALVVHDDHTVGEVLGIVREVAGARCEEVELFDLFRGASVPADHRSIAMHLVYRDPARTLTDKEVDDLHAAVVAGVRDRLRAELRA